MKLKRYLLLVLAAIFFGILFISTKSYAGDLDLKNLDFDITLNSNGTAYVTETWDISIKDTNTLFKTFVLDSKYSGLKDVSVIEVTNGRNKEFKEIYQEKYHVDKDCFYALKNKKGKFEIAWGVHEDDSSARRTFKISYTYVDAVKNYNDCSEFYCKLIGSDFEIPAKNVTGTIKLPMQVEVLDDLRVWAHGPLDGNIQRASQDTVTFDVPKLSSKTMLEVRVVTPNYVFENNTNTSSQNKFQYILEEEQGWADKANAERARAKIIWAAIVFVIVVLTGLFLGIMIKYIVDGHKLKQKYPKKKFDLKYFRDIPDEKNATPVRAAYLYYFKSNTTTMGSCLPKIFSATMLDLALKELISFEPVDDKEFNIILNKDKEADLSMDEKTVLDILNKATAGNDRVSTKELLKYSKKHYETMYTKLSLLPKLAENYHNDSSNIDEEKKKANKKWKSKGTVYLTIIFASFVLAGFVGPILILDIPLLLCSMLCFMNANKISILTDKGEEEKAQWQGLKNYMDDFSLLKEKEVPDLVLWEKYLVFATAFGISTKVIKELKVVYKELSDPDYFVTHHYAYMYYMTDTRFGGNFISTFDKTMTSVYTAASNAYSAAHSSSSSGGGYGGGFSGGGGGGFGGGGGGGR